MKNNNNYLKAVAIATLVGIGMQPILAQNNGMRLAGANVIDKSAYTNLPNFIKFEAGKEISPKEFVNWAVYAFNVPNNSTFKPYETFGDELGYTHTRYRQYVNDIPVEGTQVISHAKEGVIKIVNGDFYQNFSPVTSASLSEKDALQYALNKVNAKQYMWEDKEREAELREVFKKTNFSFYPKGQLVYVHKKGTDFSADNMRLAYKFNIYAAVPLYRANVFVDASTGEIVEEKNLICTADVVGSAVTKYSGTVTMTCDNASGPYRLQESGRGNGIITKNLATGTSYGSATDFTNSSSTWTSTGNDQAATDAHWGAEMTYDYYKNIHSRNSIDGAGYALPSYVHYSTNYANAYWDGTEMTYGDGDITQGFLIMTALDVCGHEITHGLTNFSSGLNGGGTDEASALNEGNSDIFGTTIENYARPTQWDWLIGADITCTTAGVPNHVGLRDMSNPKNLNQPNCYLGTNWDPAGECHNNDGPFNYWYYLLCQGGSGTNDIGSNWAVTGITMAEAKLIAFRQNTVYFTANTNYAAARTASIQAATDLYGICSQELASTTNAWYAIGVGTAATGGGVPTDVFSANNTLSCSTPLTVNFTNNTTGATTYNWNFGDGSTSTATSPAHTYTAGGIYAVQLIATGTCSASSMDTLTKTNYITVNGPPAISSTTAACGPQSFVLTGNGVGNITWMDAGGNTVGTGSVYTTPTLSATTTYSATSSVIVAGTATLSGAPTNTATLGGGGYLAISNNHYLIFDAVSAFTLKSVDIDAQSTSQTVSVQLVNNAGTALYTLTSTISVAGKNTLSLNWHIPVGTGYKLMASGTNSLYRNNAGASYPIAVGAVANITGNDVMSTAPTYYYWFYNWVYAADVACPSSATTVTTNITNCTTGISSNLSSSVVLVYPNPAHDNVFVSLTENINSIAVVDVIGQTVVAEQKVNNAHQIQNIDIDNLAYGIYFIKVTTTDNQQKIIRFIKN